MKKTFCTLHTVKEIRGQVYKKFLTKKRFSSYEVYKAKRFRSENSAIVMARKLSKLTGERVFVNRWANAPSYINMTRGEVVG